MKVTAMIANGQLQRKAMSSSHGRESQMLMAVQMSAKVTASVNFVATDR